MEEEVDELDGEEEQDDDDKPKKNKKRKCDSDLAAKAKSKSKASKADGETTTKKRGFRTHINGVDVWPFYVVVEAVENRPVAEQRSRIDSSRMTLTRPVGMMVVLVEDHCCSLVTNEFVGRPMRRLVRHNRIGGDGKHWRGGWRGSTIGG